MKTRWFSYFLILGCASFLCAGTGCKSRVGKKGKKVGTDLKGMVNLDATSLTDYGFSVDSEGRLLDANGQLVRGADGQPILASEVTIDEYANLVDKNGNILATPSYRLSERPENMTEIDAQYDPIHFAYDSNLIAASEREKIESIAEYLSNNSGISLVLEGHCDERGSREYNMALGERRALSVRSYLIQLGIDPERLQTNSFGEEKPSSLDHDESAWQQNRRVEFVLYK